MRRLLRAGSTTIATAVIAGFCLTPWSIAPAAPGSSPSDAPPPFEFRRLLVETNGDAPEACFRFSQSLRPQAEAHYGDYVEIEPETPLAIRTRDKDLCLGGLAFGTPYKVTLRRGLPALSGATVEAQQVVEVSLGDRAPLVSIAGQGFILPRAASNGLAIQTVNVDSVKVRVLRMSDRLLPPQLNRGNRSFFSSDGGALLSGVQMNRYQLRELLKRSASLIWSGTMAIESDHNRTVQTAFPLSEIVKPGQSGVYLIIAEPAANATSEKFFAQAPNDKRDEDDEDFNQLWTAVPAHWVIATDIALTAMSGADGLHVFARSLASGEPLPGIKLMLLAAGQDVLGEAASDRDGTAAFAPGLLRGSGANAASSVVAYGEAGDFTLIELNRPAFDLSDRGVTGRPTATAIEAFLYTERGIYRPGESVEVMALLRDRIGMAIDTMPVTLVLRRPDGVEARRLTLAARPQGGFHHALPLTKTAARGLWSAEAYVDPSGAPVGRVEFEVQDFVPQKLKVALTAARPILRPGEAIAAAVQGDFLYGAPAAGLDGEAELRIVRDASPIPEAKAYRFGLVDERFEEGVQQLEMKPTDESGHAELTDVLQPPKPTSFPLKGVLSAGLFEPSGRIVKDEVELPIRTGKPLIGIRPRFAEDRAEEGQEASFDIRVFGEDGKPIARPGLSWRLIREDRVFDWFNSGGNGWTWHYHIVDEPVGSGSLDVAEATPTTVGQIVGWGWYRLIVSDAATEAATSVRFRAGWQAAGETADTPDKLEISAEKAAYAIGDTARLRITGPFAGKAQLTIASDRVFETRAIAVPKGGTTVEVKVGADWGPGAYAVVSLYRPLTEGRPRDPVRAVGVAWLPIDPAPRTLAVALAVPDRVMPRRRVAVPLRVTGALGDGPTFVTLAAVDEGILQLTRFPTPDPASFFFGKRRLGIDIRDDYGRLLDGSAIAGAVREGGDEGIGGAGLPVTSTRTVTLFSGPVALDRDGEATIDLDIPDFEGQLHLMAVAYNRAAVGHGEGRVIVRDPVVAELALPRFLAPADSARLALLLHNTDGGGGAYHLAVSASGAARITVDHALDYTLGAGEQKRDSLAIEGLDEGVATIAADLTGPNGYAVHRDWQIAVRAPHYPIALEESAVQAPGESFRVDAEKLKPFVPGSVSISLGYSAFSGIDVASLLQSLYRYPYGCTEQLSSSAFPLIYFNDPALLGSMPQDAGVKARVQAAIDTILDRVDAAGEFGLWRAGDGEASPWLNVYALDFLVHARDAGFAVPDAALQRSYNWIKQTIRQVDQANRGAYSASPDATRAYAAYVLARAGRADLGELRRAHDAMSWSTDTDRHIAPASVYWSRRQNDDGLAEPLSLGQLAGALSLMGDRARARNAFALALANLETGNRYPRWWFDYTYYSGLRDLSGLIAISAEIGDAMTAQTLIERLKALSPSAARLNTQEKAWLLAAAHAFSGDTSGRALAVDGREIAKLKLPAAFAPSLAEIARGYQVTNTGSRDIWRTVVIRGAPKLAPSAMEAGFSLKREYLSLDGDPIDPAQLTQNDRLIVSLSGHVADNESHRAVLVDLLPAGWEIEAVITKPETYGFLAPLSRAKVAEARDDRFVAAFDLGEGFNEGRRRFFVREQDENAKQLPADAFHVAYLVRVVTPGTFGLPEAVVEDMYRPGVMARTDAGETTVAPR